MAHLPRCVDQPLMRELQLLLHSSDVAFEYLYIVIHLDNDISDLLGLSNFIFVDSHLGVHVLDLKEEIHLGLYLLLVSQFNEVIEVFHLGYELLIKGVYRRIPSFPILQMLQVHMK